MGSANEYSYLYICTVVAPCYYVDPVFDNLFCLPFVFLCFCSEKLTHGDSLILYLHIMFQSRSVYTHVCRLSNWNFGFGSRRSGWSKSPDGRPRFVWCVCNDVHSDSPCVWYTIVVAPCIVYYYCFISLLCALWYLLRFDMLSCCQYVYTVPVCFPDVSDCVLVRWKRTVMGLCSLMTRLSSPRVLHLVTIFILVAESNAACHIQHFCIVLPSSLM